MTSLITCLAVLSGCSHSGKTGKRKQVTMSQTLNILDTAGSFGQNWNTKSLGDLKPAARRSRSAKPFRNSRKAWIPNTKLGRLVKNGYVTSLEEIHRNSLSITEVDIVDNLLKDSVSEEVLNVIPVVKQSSRGPRTRFKAFVAVGDHAGHLGLGIKCYKEIASAIRGAVQNAKLAMITVRRGAWNSSTERTWSSELHKREFYHTVAGKASGESGNSKVRLLPAPKNTGIVGAMHPAQTTILNLAGIKDCYILCDSSYNAVGNVIKALLNALVDLERLEGSAEVQMPPPAPAWTSSKHPGITSKLIAQIF